MGQKDGVLEERRSQKWTAAADLQSPIFLSPRLLGGAQRFIVVAAPALLARSTPPPAHPRDLLQAPCLRQRFASGAMFRWEFERGNGQNMEQLTLDISGPLLVDDQSVALAAALEGAGFAFVYECAAREHLLAGRLIQVLGDWRPAGTGFSLYYPGRSQASPALRAFIGMVKAQGFI